MNADFVKPTSEEEIAVVVSEAASSGVPLEILGGGTRAAVRAEQIRLGMPADGWPTRQLLNAL